MHRPPVDRPRDADEALPASRRARGTRPSQCTRPSGYLGPILAAALLTAGCAAPKEGATGGGEAGQGSRAAEGSPGRPSVVLVTVDTLRADVLGFARAPGEQPGNHGRAETPTLDRLAAEGRVYPFAHAHSVMTLPSHANILTGLLPYQHGIRDNGGFVLAGDIPTLATLLADAGYATAAFVAAYPLDARYGLDRGFDVYDDVEVDLGLLEGGLPDPRQPFGERRGDEMVRRALAWWREQAPVGKTAKPRFLWLHLFDPHGPYQPPEPFASRYAESPYLGEVAAVDAYLEPLARAILEGAEPVLTVFTSDHGEALGDHGEATHGLFAYESTLRVPLFLHGAHLPEPLAPGADSRPARHVDLVPTILDLLGLEPPPDLTGRSLLGPASTEPATTYFEALAGHLNHGWAPLRGLLRDRAKAIDLPLPELYDLDTDPVEAENRFDDERRRHRELLAALPTESEWPPAAGALDSEEMARLRSLGYLSSRGGVEKTRFNADDDPKRLIGIVRDLEELLLLFHRGDFDRVTALAESILERRASTPLAHTYLALAYLKQRRPDRALAAMERAVEAGAASVDLRRQMGLTLLRLGQPERAAGVLAELVDSGAAPADDGTAINNLALALLALGRADEARGRLEGLLETAPENPGTWENLAFVALESNDAPGAEAASRRALELDAESAGAWNNLALALYQQGRGGDAIDGWRRALELEPRNPDPLFNVGLVAAELGRTELAREALRTFASAFPDDHPDPRVAEARRLLAELGN